MSSKAKMKKFDTMDSRSRGLLKDIMKRIDMRSFDLMSNPVFKQGQNFLSQMMNPQSQVSQDMEAPYRRQYSEEIVPHIAEQFSMYDAQDSSAFTQAMGRSAEQLEGNIAGMRQNVMQGASQNMLNYAQAPGYAYQNLVNSALGHQGFGYQAMPGTEGWGQGAFSGIAAGASSALGSYAMGRMGFGGGGMQPSSQMFSAENYL